MSKIQVPPEVLIQVAEKFRVDSLQMEWRVSSLDHQMETMLMWEGTTRQRFFEDYHRARNDMTKTIEYMISISEELKRIANRFKLVDEELLPLALVGRNEEPKEWFEEAWDSFKGLGNDFVEASNERYDKRYSSVWGFLDYWTAGIPQAAYQGYVDRANKPFSSPNDFANYMTLGVHETIRETLFPTKAWSEEHMVSIFGSAGLVAGGALVKPKDVLRLSVKSEVGNGKKGLKGEADGGGVAKQAEQAGKDVKLNEPIKVKTNKGIEVEFTNPSGNTIKYVEQNPKNIPNAIENAKNSSNAGKAVEGKVGDFIQQKTEVTGFGVEVRNLTLGKKATDVDIATNTQIIEVKKSVGAVKTDQIDRLTNPNNIDFFNYDSKEVILYIDEPLKTLNKFDLEKIEFAKSQGVTIVNSLEELRSVLK